MTVAEILRELKPAKPMSRPTLYRHMVELKIKPVSSVQQHPQHYPANTPKRILKRLGLNGRNHRRAAA